MTTIKENLEKLKSTIPNNVTLIAVSKTHPADTVKEAIEAGQMHFGENKVQELLAKAKELPSYIHWHMIGHLQTNKVKKLLPFVSLIHSVDSLRLAVEINKEASKQNIIVSCLLQIHIAQEETKYGFSLPEAEKFIQSSELSTLKHIKIKGLMGMASNVTDFKQIRKEFSSLKKFYDEIKRNYTQLFPDFTELSMGMSNDYQIAIDEGSTMIRIGSLIFGERNYNQR